MDDTRLAVLAAVAVLLETKDIGTRKLSPEDKDIDLVTRVHQAVDPVGFARARKTRTRSAAKSYEKIRNQFKKKLIGLVKKKRVSPETLSDHSFGKSARVVLRDAYKQAYVLGKHSTGTSDVTRLVYGHIDPGAETPLTPEDKRWLNSAIKHESKFLRGFVRDVAAGKGKMAYDRRAKMYVNALDNIYNSARIQGTPSDVLLYWVTSKSCTTCESCKYLEKMSPYTKHNIPTLPRSGATKCLTNCKCKVVARKMTAAQLRKPWALKTKTYLLRKLQQIKRG